MVVRGLGRNRRRAVFTVVGVAVSLSLVLVFAGLRDTVANVLDRQYGTVDRSDGQLYATPGKTAELVAAARRDPAVAAAEPFARVEASLTHGTKRFDTILVGLARDTTMHRFVEPGGRHVTLPASGVLLGRGLGNLLSIHTGDEVTITAADGTRLVEPVAGFVDEPLTAVAYTSLDHLEPRPSAVDGLRRARPASVGRGARCGDAPARPAARRRRVLRQRGARANVA